ncbi:MAG: T9SS type A sorting domain-containing protein [Lentimicrobium sp.]|nr:T9SS type A sorting domain-containing protein [Lentimicrobium sp.]
MKTKITTAFSLIALLVVFNFSRLQAQTPGSVEMGQFYANEVFYSLTNGVVKTSPRSIWDIAFYTDAFSAGIVTNDGAGVELYTYPNAAADGWDSFDTTGMASWPKMYNDPSDWQNGAFDRNQKGHPDYGWGVYSMTSHDVIGDSLFLIKTPDGIFRKLNIIRKYSTLNKYEIRFSLLDGQQDQTVTLDVNPYNDRVMMAYSFTNGIVDREPLAAEWDVLFTKYMGLVQNQPYGVVGVLANPEVQVARLAQTDPAFTDWSELDFETGDDIIGYDWKYFDMGSFQYVIEDSLMYFVKAQEGGVYKLVFDGFTGSSTGISTFNTSLLSALGINDPIEAEVRVFPNPASEYIQVSLPGNSTQATAGLYDLSGKLLRSWNLESGSSARLELNGFNTGLYILKVENGNVVTNTKVMLQQ